MDNIPPLNTVDSACALTGLGRTSIYCLLGRGALVARKSGKRTLITGQSIRSYIDSLPQADIRTGRNLQRGG
jgi:hypothetical protein